MTMKTTKARFVKHAVCVLMALFGASQLMAAEITVDNFSDICGWSTNAVVCAVGDTVVLPELGSGGEYTNNNSRVASLAGNIVTALEPGFTGVLDPEGLTGGIIVRPSVGGSGRVFVANIDTTVTLKNNFTEFQWCNAANWICVYGNGENDYPNGTDDVAIIPFAVQTSYATYDEGGYIVDLIGAGDEAEVVLGQLFMGSFAACKINCHLAGGSTSGTIHFRRTDGATPRIAFTGGSAATDESWIRTKANSTAPAVSAPALDLEQGLAIDLGYAGIGKPAPHVFFVAGSLNLPEGCRLVVENGRPDYEGSDGTDPGILFDKDFMLAGEGIIRNDSDMNLRVNSEGEAIFSGLWESGGKRPKSISASPVGAGIDFRKATAAGCTATSDGAFSIESNWGAYDSYRFQYSGSGGIKIGSGDNNYNSGTGIDFYPDRLRVASHVILNSGLLGIWPEHHRSKDWGSEALTTRVDRLTFGYGLSKLYFWGKDASDTKGPTNFVDIVSVDHQNRSQAYVYSSAFWGADAAVDETGAKVKARFVCAENLATNGVIPWMTIISRRKGLVPARVNENGFLYTTARENKKLNDAEPGEDVTVNTKSLSITSDRTVNSVSIGSISGQPQYLGADRTLTITSGALFLWDGSSIVGVEGGDQNGRIVFAAPAYVHTIVATNTCAQINLPLVATKGIAFGAPGGVRVTGDQTGIMEELAVNGCRLVLGTTTTAAQLDVDIRVAGGYSVLDVQNVNSNFLRNHKLTLQDSGNYPAKVNLGSNTTYRVKELFVGGKQMKGGTYGSSESAAGNKDDEHFSGTGMLLVSGSGLSVYIR